MESAENKKKAVFHVRVSIHAKRPLYLILVIQFFFESADFLLIAANAVNLHTAQDCDGNASAQKKTDDKVQHSFITSLSCGASEQRKAPSVCSSPVKFGSIS